MNIEERKAELRKLTAEELEEQLERLIARLKEDEETEEPEAPAEEPAEETEEPKDPEETEEKADEEHEEPAEGEDHEDEEDEDELEARALSAVLREKRDAAAVKEQRRAQIAAGTIPTKTERTFKEEKKMEFTRESLEYRNAWLKHLRGDELTDMETRAFSENAGAIATMTANDIVTAIRRYAPLLDKISLVRTGAAVTYYVEGTIDPAAAHTANQVITAAADALVPVSLTPAEIVKMLQASKGAKKMSIEAFESWVTDNIGKSLAAKISEMIITAIRPSTAAATSFTAANVQTLLGSVDGNVALVCNRATLFTKLLPLQDNSKNSIVRFEGNDADAYVYGCPVYIDAAAQADELIAGDLSKCVGALAEEVGVVEQFDIDTNSYKYLGSALFDVKVGIAAAFAKIKA